MSEMERLRLTVRLLQLSVGLLIVAVLWWLFTETPRREERPAATIATSEPGADHGAPSVVSSARDPLNGRESPRHRPAGCSSAAARRSECAAGGAETAGLLAPITVIGPPLSVERGVLPDTGTSVTGLASWFCRPGVSRCTRGYPASGAFAAAGPALRVGDWRGRIVTVRSGGRSIRVRLTDWCACGGGKVIDLYASQFQKLAPLSRGIIRVSVTWTDDGPSQTVPPTSTSEETMP